MEKQEKVEVKQKWVNENGIFFPVPGNTALHLTPGSGVFQIYEQTSMGGSRLGLAKIADKFVFDFKVYDLGIEKTLKRIEKTWNSDTFVEGNRNFGIILNGLKGTGKTIASKILSNRLGIPVVIVNAPFKGLVEFIQSLCFECVVLIDEAEKVFAEDGHVLLRMIDGVYNESRKFYILTTNQLTIDDNLKGRPGRIWYMKQFGNLTAEAIQEYIKDNLKDQSKSQIVLDTVDILEISTIDILKSIVDEVNIHGDIEDSLLNIPKANYRLNIVRFGYNMPKDQFPKIKEFIRSRLAEGESVGEWLNKFWKEWDDEKHNNDELIDETFNTCTEFERISTNRPYLSIGQDIRYGWVLESPDDLGFFVIRNYYDNEELCCVLNWDDAPSLYRGRLHNLVF